MLALITSRLGVHVRTVQCQSIRATVRTFNRMRAAGEVDSAGVWIDDQCVAVYGSGR